MKIGLKSTAVLFGAYIRPLAGIFAAIFVLSLAICGILNGNGLWYFVVSVGGAIVHFWWQLSTWEESVPGAGGAKFKVSRGSREHMHS